MTQTMSTIMITIIIVIMIMGWKGVEENLDKVSKVISTSNKNVNYKNK